MVEIRYMQMDDKVFGTVLINICRKQNLRIRFGTEEAISF